MNSTQHPQTHPSNWSTVFSSPSKFSLCSGGGAAPPAPGRRKVAKYWSRVRKKSSLTSSNWKRQINSSFSNFSYVSHLVVAIRRYLKPEGANGGAEQVFELIHALAGLNGENVCLKNVEMRLRYSQNTVI
jgi:hypothetical protein